MVRLTRLALMASAAAALLAVGCDEETDEHDGLGGSGGCSPVDQTGCAGGQVCEEVQGGEPACFAPLRVAGRVFDLLDDSDIEGARVVARDANEAAVSTVAISAADGSYSLVVPAKRSANGEPVSSSVTLRADAEAYLSFPKAPRVALPLDQADAAGDPLVLQSSATDIGLTPLAETDGLGSIAGSVATERPGGTLVVAAGLTAIADFDGDFVVFNVPAGELEVRGYTQGINLEGQTVTVAAGQQSGGVVLSQLSEATADVTGKVDFANAPGASVTSVVLAVEETFIEDLARGEVPRGLRAGGVTGDFTIIDVPNGDYAVLAAFENDGLVRDPSDIGGTDIVHITVDGDDLDIAQHFKVTGALAVVSPGAAGLEEVSGNVTFVWEDDSNEDSYEVTLFDALGNAVWQTVGDFDPGGSAPASVDYDGEALTAGMIYQFRAVSIKDGVPQSSTEDLKGVFVYQ